MRPDGCLRWQDNIDDNDNNDNDDNLEDGANDNSDDNDLIDDNKTTWSFSLIKMYLWLFSYVKRRSLSQSN